MTSKDLEVVEIYPNILVYKNLFNDIEKSYKILLDSLTETDDRLFSPWTQWSIFGEYLNPIIPSFSVSQHDSDLKNIKATTEIEKNQKEFVVEMMKNFYLATNHYIEKYGIDVDLSATSTDESGQTVPTWRCTGGTVGKYNISNEDSQFGMNYHSDYQRERADAPGYKFIITSTTYFNDDYEHGEIDFAMGNQLVKYKPEAGDILVFPSGHPDYLTKDGMVYLHGVMPSYNKHKFLSRMYWEKYQKGTDEWYKKEKEFGKEVWASMQKDLEKKFLEKSPQRGTIKDGVRIV
jgi:hypothetical protein